MTCISFNEQPYILNNKRSVLKPLRMLSYSEAEYELYDESSDLTDNLWETISISSDVRFYTLRSKLSWKAKQYNDEYVLRSTLLLKLIIVTGPVFWLILWEALFEQLIMHFLLHHFLS